MEVSHLLFMNDMLLFCEAGKEQLMNWRWTLIYFDIIADLKVDLQKSKLIPMREVLSFGRREGICLLSNCVIH